jgi:YD repeat-containing protein
LSYYPRNEDTFTITRDTNGHPIEIAESPDEVRQIDFTWANGLIATSTVHSVTTTYTQDPATLNVASTVDTVGRSSAFTYDAAGNTLTANDGTTVWSFSHDANGRLSAATDAENNTTTLAYVQGTCGCSEADLLTSLHTPDLSASQAWKLAYTKEGRLSTLTDPDGHIETYGYDPQGDLDSLVDRNGHSTLMGYDHLGRLTSILDAIERTHSRAYATPSSGAWSGQNLMSGSASTTSASTSLTSTLNPGDYQIGTNGYQLLSSTSNSTGWPAIELYRDATFQLSFGRTFDIFDRTQSVQDRPSSQFASLTPQPTGSGTVVNNNSIVYVNGTTAPIVASDTWNVTGVTWGTTFQTTNEYDISSYVGDETYGSVQTHTVYTRDVAGRPTNVQVNESNVGGHPTMTLNQAYTYDANGLIATSPQGNFTYDDRGLAHTRAVTPPNNAHAAGTYTYGYDVRGRNNSLTYPDGHTRTQTYDDEGRINQRCYVYPQAPGGPVQHCYEASYDNVGNPTTLTDPWGQDTVTYDSLDRITSVSDPTPIS